VDGESTAPGWALGGVPGEIEWPALTPGFWGLCGEQGSYFRAADSLAKLHGDGSVTTKAKGSNVIEVTLAASFCYGQNVIGIPQTFADSDFKPPMAHQGFASSPARTLKLSVLSDRVHRAVGAHSSISLENVFAQIPRLRSQLPLVYAIF
jgi:hypothetical protein